MKNKFSDAVQWLKAKLSTSKDGEKRGFPVVACVAAAALVIVITADALASKSPPEPAIQETQPEYIIELDDGGFDSDGVLLLSGVEDLSESYLQEHLTIYPYTPFKVTKPEYGGEAQLKIKSGYVKDFTVSLKLPGIQMPRTWKIGGELTVKVIKSTVSVGESVFLNFSHAVDKKELLRNLSITPRVSYNVKCSGTAAEIWFEKRDNIEGAYMIDIGGSLLAVDGAKLSRPQQFSITIQKKEEEAGYSVRMTNRSIQIAPAGRPILLEFEAQSKKTVSEVPAIIHTYKFDSIEKFQNQASKYYLYHVDPEDSLTRVSSDLHILTTGASAIELENPGPGGYIIKAEYENPLTKEKDFILRPVMVTDVSVYMQSLNGRSLLWANNGATGRPLSGHTVEMLDQNGKELASAATDSSGVAIFEIDITDREARPEYVAMRIRDAGGSTVYIDRTYDMSWHDYGYSNRYFSYFYLDRSIYKPTDTISFWGFVKPHASNGEPTPKQVRVVLDPRGLDHSVTAEVDGSGMFHGELKLEQIKSANYDIQTVIDLDEPLPETDYSPATSQRVLDYEYIEVKQYEKPLFQIECSSDKSLYNYNESVKLEVKPTFYDGTLLPNYELELTVYDSYYGNVVKTETFMTDGSGVAKVSFPAYTAASNTAVSWRPLYNRYQVRIISDGENTVHNGSYYYMPTDLMVTGEIRENESAGIELRVRTEKLASCSGATPEQTEALIALNSMYYSTEYTGEKYGFMRGGITDAKVTADVNLRYFLDNGTYERFSERYELQTVSGEAVLPVELPKDIDKDRSFYAEVTFSATDERAHKIEHRADYSSYNYTARWHTEREEPEGYTFAVTRANGESALEDYYNYSYNEAYFNDGESMTFLLLYNGEPVENKGRILYTVLQDDLIQRGFTTARSFSFTESTRWANNVNIVAAYFDGTNVHPIFNTVVRFNRDSAKLNVEITPGKEKYMPGETASVTVRVTDSKGRGVAGNACVSVVDEAVFALRGQSVDTLQRLYNGLTFYNYRVVKYTTLTSRGIREDDGRGDIGKSNVENLAFYDIYRKNFKDTACFVPVRTNSSGYASVSFVVPDNTTLWRVTSVAIGDNLYAGNNTANFASSLPFFINPVISSKYIEGDDIAMLVQGHGSLLDENSKISYTVRVKGDKTDLTETAENTAYQSNLINFGKLPAGEYTVIATARYSGYSDTVEIPLAVVSSNLELVVSKELDLSSPQDINAMRYPVTLSFYDQEYAAYYKSISSLLTHYCMIANQRMSRFVAKRSLMKYMDPDNIPQHIAAGNDSASDMQNYDGGIGWNVGDESDILLTTQVLLIAKDQFNLNSMSKYFYNVIDKKDKNRNTTGEEIASSYLGLAYIGEPVSKGVLALLNKDDTPMLEKAYLIAALAYGGETEEALLQYKKYISPLLTVSGKSAYVRSPEHGTDDKSSDYLTKAAWLAASKLGLDDADMIALHFASARWRINSLFECMAYVTNYNKAVEPASFTYFVNGAGRREDLGVYGQKTIVLSKSEFETFKMGNMPERLRATAYYIGEPSEADLRQSDKIKVDKTITQVADKRYRVDLSVEVSQDALSGYYDISEWIPSNMKFYDLDKTGYKRGDHWWYNYSTEGQKMYFRLYRSSLSARTMRISYFIQKTYDAETVVDRTYVIHGDSGESAFTDRYAWDVGK